MERPIDRPVSGHVFRVDRRRGPVWYAKYRLPDGRQLQRKLGPAWTSRGRPADGYFTKRTAQAWLDDTLARARDGTLPGLVRTGATFADAAAEWLRYVEQERAVKPSTLSDYRHMVQRLNVAFGKRPIEDITTADLDRWKARKGLSNKTIAKYLIALHGIFKRAKRAYGLPSNPAADVERPRFRLSDDVDAFSPEEVWALVRAAESELDATLFLTAAFTGLRMGELLALRWGDVDFRGQAIRVRRSFTIGGESSPKSGKVRAVPMVPDVAEALARLADRERLTRDGDLVFAGDVGGHLDSNRVRKRYQATVARAGLRPLRFHDLRHTFGTLAINRASILQVKEWMGHAAVQTTMRYLHHKSREGEAALLAEAFRVGPSRVSATAE